MPVIQPHFGHLAVQFRPGARPADKRAAALHCHLEAYSSRHDLPGESYALVPVAAGTGDDRVRHRRAMAALGRHRHVIDTNRVFRHRKTLVVVTDRIWVGLSAGSKGQAVLAGIRRRGGTLVRRHGSDFLIRLPVGLDPGRECARLARLAAVEYAEPDHVIMGRSLTAATRKPARRVQAALATIRVSEAWRLQTIDRSTVVAVLDCGVDATHPDLRGAITRHFNVTGHGSAIRPAPWDSHGTECAGLVAAIGRPGGLRGVAGGCGLFAIRTGYTPNRLDGIYVTKVSWQVEGIEWAWRNGAGVLSMSVVGGPRATPVERALARARTLGREKRGTVLVAAAGNDGAAHVAFPASAAGVLGVAATYSRGRRASFSNWGAAIDLAAPGVNITTTTIPDPTEDELGLYFTDSGTSLATPIVAGVAALVLAANSTLRAGQVQALLTATASGSKRRNPRVGAGVVNAATAVRAAQALPTRPAR